MFSSTYIGLILGLLGQPLVFRGVRDSSETCGGVVPTHTKKIIIICNTAQIGSGSEVTSKRLDPRDWIQDFGSKILDATEKIQNLHTIYITEQETSQYN